MKVCFFHLKAHAIFDEQSEAPIGGWVSRRFDRKVAAPTLVWKARLAGDSCLRTSISCE